MYVSQYPRAMGLKIPEDAKEEEPIEITENIHTLAHTPYILKMTYGSSDNGNAVPIVVTMYRCNVLFYVFNMLRACLDVRTD